ncbi:MAG: hypothetical protein ACK4ZJ_16625, partial [Allorhizobium sp.]
MPRHRATRTHLLPDVPARPQHKRCLAAFGSPQRAAAVLCALVRGAVEPVTPSFRRRVEAEFSLPAVQSLLRSASTFAEAVRAKLQPAGPLQVMLALRALVGPFVPYLGQYGELETEQLAAALREQLEVCLPAAACLSPHAA